MECINENYTLSTHFDIPNTHTKSEHFKENTLPTRFVTLVDLTPLFCTYTTCELRQPCNVKGVSSNNPASYTNQCAGLCQIIFSCNTSAMDKVDVLNTNKDAIKVMSIQFVLALSICEEPS